jgi:hypothetical protein
LGDACERGDSSGDHRYYLSGWGVSTISGVGNSQVWPTGVLTGSPWAWQNARAIAVCMPSVAFCSLNVTVLTQMDLR